MITGSQIRAARNLLGWDRKLLARACKLRPETLARAESVDDEPPITVAHARAIRSTLEQAGIEFRTGASSGVVLPQGNEFRLTDLIGTLPIALRGAFPGRNNGISEQDRTTIAGRDLWSTSKSASDTLRYRGPLT